MKHYIAVSICLMALLAFPFSAKAQSGVIIQGKVTSSTDGLELIGASVTEIDKDNRVVNGTATDVNGHYVIRIRSTENKLTISYLGFEKKIVNIGSRTTINVVLNENVNVIREVVVSAQAKSGQGGYSIPKREVGTAVQSISTKEFEGLQVTSIDDALQGMIAGLDIVANSGDPGSASSMRIRGVSTINANAEPLIVLNGIPWTVDIDENFDFSSSNEEQYANMLSINAEDIEQIEVLKDAAASAIWGSKGANGVIMITTKRGSAGATRVEYTYRYTQARQPAGRKMLNGDGYTMYIKEAYLNPRQDDDASNKSEYNYDKNDPNYENYNNNTDWVKEVTQTGATHDHYLTISGGGERGSYRASAGYLTQRGMIIGQKMDRFSSRLKFDYYVSDRIRFFSEISLTHTDNQRNYENLLNIAYKKMPNVSIYSQDKNGNNTNEYYNIPLDSELDDDQKYLKNPIALSALATNQLVSTRIVPQIGLLYDLMDPKKHTLRLNLNASFDTGTDKTVTFLPQSATNRLWTETDIDKSVNKAETYTNERLQVFTDNNLLFVPTFENRDHSVTLYGSMQMTIGNLSNQKIISYGLTSEDAINASNAANLNDIANDRSSWRGIAFLARGHYAYKGRYIIDGSVRREGSTRFGKGNQWGTFPGVSLKWITSDEAFFDPLRPVFSHLAFRPSWGISGNQPASEYLHFSRYAIDGTYIDLSAVKPNSLRLDDLKWETSKQYNYGAELGFFDDRLRLDFNYYTTRTEDLLFKDVAISSISGFSSLAYINGGTMDKSGWDVNLNLNRIIRKGKFSMDFVLNLAYEKNILVSLEQTLLDGYNTDFDFENGSYMTRIQEGNPFGSIYGFRYKGVYKYDTYEAAMQNEGTVIGADGKLLAPVAVDAQGNVILDQNGQPKTMHFAYNNTSKRHEFRGGDAIYEDINNDGSIDELDIVYLGNSNPLLNGGFGPTFRYGNLSCRLFFTFRYGNDIINKARMNAENMYYDNNQSEAVNWRWRKDGDVTDMPRALYKYGYNWLGSDRYVEDGSFLRLKYLTFNYAVPKKILDKYQLNKATLSLTVNNLFILTNYKGVDPEVGYGSLGLSFDNNSTPRAKDFTIGLSVGF